MNPQETLAFIEGNYDALFLDHLKDFIRIPNLSPSFDPEFFTNGHIDRAVDYVVDFAKNSGVPNLTTHVHRSPGKAPLVLITYEGAGDKNVMIYGHLDKQPHLTEGWSEGLSPIEPVVRDNKIYGRGACDDGYVPFAAIMCIKAALAQNAVLPRIVITLECEEESGSHNLLESLDGVAHLLKKPDFLICLDSENADYTKLWVTSSLKGMVTANIRAEVVSQGTHSGLGGGIVPETFSILRALLDRIDNSTTGKVVDAFRSPVPKDKQEESLKMATHYGPYLYKRFAWLPGCEDSPFSKNDLAQMYLNAVWEPALAIVGASGMPPSNCAGNVLRPYTELRLALRLPPNMDSKKAHEEFTRLMTTDVPCNAKITLTDSSHGHGYMWNELQPWVTASLHKASTDFFDSEFGSYGLGGSIPFLSELGTRFPSTQIITLGAMGPGSNAHNPDECLDIPYSKKMFGAIAHIIASLGAHQE